MPTPPTARSARRTIAAIVADLVDVHDRLVALRAALPAAPEGAAEEGSNRDPRAELVGAIECVVHDDLKPAIRSLCVAAALPAEPPLAADAPLPQGAPRRASPCT